MTFDHCVTSYRSENWSEMVHIKSSDLITVRLSIGDQSKSMQNQSKSEYRTLCKWPETAFIAFDII